MGTEPFRADLAAVALEEGEAISSGDLVKLVGFGLGSMVFPQLYPGMRIAAIRGKKAQRGAIRFSRQHGAGGEIDAEADHIGGIDAAFFKHCGNGMLEYLDVIVGVLERPIRGQAYIGAGKLFIDDAVGILVNGGGDVLPVDTSTRTARPDSVPKSTPIAYFIAITISL